MQLPEYDTKLKRGNWDRKWRTLSSRFTNLENQMMTTTNIFRNANIKLVCAVNNTIQKNVAVKQDSNKYKQNGMYKLKCIQSNKVYIGQTGRNCKARRNDHISTTLDTIRSQHMQNTSWAHIRNMEKLKTIWTIWRLHQKERTRIRGTILSYTYLVRKENRPCGLLVRVSGYRSRGPRFDSRPY
jgi:hypothetical protein